MSPQWRRLEVGGCEREQKMMCFITCVITVSSWPVEALKPPIRGARSVMTPSGRQILLRSSLNTFAPHPPPSPSHLTLICPLHDLALRPSPSISSHYPLHADRPPSPVLASLLADASDINFLPENRKGLKYSVSPGRLRRRKKTNFEYSVFVMQV